MRLLCLLLGASSAGSKVMPSRWCSQGILMCRTRRVHFDKAVAVRSDVGDGEQVLCHHDWGLTDALFPHVSYAQLASLHMLKAWGSATVAVALEAAAVWFVQCSLLQCIHCHLCTTLMELLAPDLVVAAVRQCTGCGCAPGT